MSNIKLIDLHTHVLHDVDDGSRSIEMSIEMLKLMIEDGVTDVVLTPHNQTSVTRASREEQFIKFKELKEQTKGLNINLHFGAEVMYNSSIDTNYKEYTINDSKYVLIEFRTQREVDVVDVCYRIIHSGFIPIIAHIERYSYLDYLDYYKLKELGALIQINSGAILRERSRKEYKLSMKLIKDKLVDFIATDSHNITTRKPRLKESYLHLKKKRIDEGYLEKIYYYNQKEVLKSE